jgi:hypothetical protein
MFIRFVSANELSVTSWWTASGIGNTSVVSPINDLVERSKNGRVPTLTELLRLIDDPVVLGGGQTADPRSRTVPGRIVVEGTGPTPRFTLPFLAPGRPVTTVLINPQADGTFKVVLPLGNVQVGAASGLPSGFSIASMSYGKTDMLQGPATVGSSDDAELIIVLKR